MSSCKIVKVIIVINLTPFHCLDVQSYIGSACLHLRELTEAAIDMVSNKKNQDWENWMTSMSQHYLQRLPSLRMFRECFWTWTHAHNQTGSTIFWFCLLISPLSESARVLRTRFEELVVSIAMGRWVGCVISGWYTKSYRSVSYRRCVYNFQSRFKPFLAFDISYLSLDSFFMNENFEMSVPWTPLWWAYRHTRAPLLSRHRYSTWTKTVCGSNQAPAKK